MQLPNVVMSRVGPADNSNMKHLMTNELKNLHAYVHEAEYSIVTATCVIFRSPNVVRVGRGTRRITLLVETTLLRFFVIHLSDSCLL